MGYQWDINGKTIGYQWDINGKTIGYQWDINGKTIGYQWDINRKTIGIQLVYFGCSGCFKQSTLTKVALSSPILMGKALHVLAWAIT